MTEITTFLPSYDVCPEYNADLLRQSIPLMVKNKVSAHPINYAIWYEYVAGNNKRLNNAVDELLKNNKLFDEATSLELYKDHVCNASIESFEKINSDLQVLIDNTAVAVQDSGHKVSSTGDKFMAKSLQLEQINDLTDVKSILASVAEETRQLAEISRNLKAKLHEANDELAALRSELTKTREMATMDSLTGLLNRRAFDNELSELVKHSIGSAHCLLILDLDHFKKVNDTFGHVVGDKVIRYAAGILKKYVADHHFAARYGGEEMAVIMPDTELTHAMEIAEMVKESMAKGQLKQKQNGVSIGKITVSIGVTALKIDDDIESFIARADNALYTAKESGRNKVVQH